MDGILPPAMASVTTRDHDEIQDWAQARGATPSVVSRTGGMLRFEFAPEGEAPSELAPVAWDDFFQVFDDKGLELVYDDKPASRFHKLIYPETAQARSRGERTAARPARARLRENIPAAGADTGRSRARRSTGSRTAAAGRATGATRTTSARAKRTGAGKSASSKKAATTASRSRTAARPTAAKANRKAAGASSSRSGHRHPKAA